jgi:hypothetical protein
MAKNPLETGLRPLSLSALFLLLAACFGGIGDGEVEGFKRGADASGIWFGKIDVDGEAQNIGAVLIARPDGTMYMDTDVGMLVGEAGTRGNAFTADTDGYSYQEDFPDGSEFSLNAVVNSQQSIVGSFSGSARSGIFEFDYDPQLSTHPAAVQTIAGTYSAVGRIRNAAGGLTLTIGSYGELSGDTGTGCTVTGTVSVLDSPRNLYEWHATLAGCPINGEANGIGIGQDGPEGRGFRFIGTVNGSAIAISGFNGPGPTMLGFGSVPRTP